MTDYKELEVRADILAAAKRVFQRWGVNKTTMEDIASEAGKGKSSLYYYFKSKDEIFESCMDDEMAGIVAKTQRQLPNDCGAKQKLRIYVASMLREMHQTASIYPLVKGEMRGNRDFIDRVTRKIVGEQERIALEILTEGVQSGEFRYLDDYPLAKVARVIVAAVIGISVQLILEDDNEDEAEILAQVITEGL